jgi:F0F1-type ATP synthase assembly protein I
LPQNPHPDPEREKEEENAQSETTRRVRSYARYSGMAIQMAVIILLGAYGGRALDNWAATDKPYFTVGGSLLAIGAALYVTLKDLTTNK